jgi:ATP-dependent DNA ligase
LVSRNGNILSRFDALCEQLAAELDVANAIMDGEVIAVDDPAGRSFSTSSDVCPTRCRKTTC